MVLAWTAEVSCSVTAGISSNFFIELFITGYCGITSCVCVCVCPLFHHMSSGPGSTSSYDADLLVLSLR